MKPKFVIGIGLIAAAMLAIVVFSILGNSSQEIQVNDLVAQKANNANLTDRSLKLNGIVVGDSVSYDPKTLRLEFDVVNSREDLINNLSKAHRVRIVYNGAKPDTLVNEAHAIVTGKVAADGKFHAGDSPDALMLQCPTKYESPSG